jgi:hypothetical protein
MTLSSAALLLEVYSIASVILPGMARRRMFFGQAHERLSRSQHSFLKQTAGRARVGLSPL